MQAYVGSDDVIAACQASAYKPSALHEAYARPVNPQP